MLPLDSGAVETFSGQMNLYSLTVGLMNEFNGCQENVPTTMHSANSKFWWRRDCGLGLFFRVWARPLKSSEE